MQWPKNKNDADSEQQFHRLEAGVPGQSSSMSSWSSSASVPTRVREPPPSPQCLPAGVSVPLPAPSQGPSQPSLAQPFSESGTWSLLSLPCAATSSGSETLPTTQIPSPLWDAHLWHPSISPSVLEAQAGPCYLLCV